MDGARLRLLGRWLSGARACPGPRGALLRRALRSRRVRLLLLAAAGLALAPALALLVVHLTPAELWIDPARFARPHDAFSVLDREGRPLRQARVGGADRRWVALADVSPHLVDAVLAAEDARFREHHGVDALATARAVITLVRPWGRRSGASTISQQLVKRVYGRPLGLLSKPLEIARADALERLFTKDEILEQYLNRLPFGDRIEGVDRASREYFGHPAATLGVAEAALLAGIPQAPSATEPRRHLDRALRRRDHVLARLAALGKIDEAARVRAAAEVPAIRAVAARPDEAPRFVDAALARHRSGEVDRSDGALRTSLDLELQRRTEAVMTAAVGRFAARGVTNGAAIVVANASGEILAYVGAARTGAPGGALDLLQRRRQPGSTLKPFAYELFFERGGTAATVLDDIALVRTGARGAFFEARDYDGRERGPVRARVALASSLNLAALDAAGRVGQDALVDRLRALGFRGVGRADRYGAAAVLGGLDVAPIDLAAAYVALARGGTRVPLAHAPAPAAAGARLMRAEAAELTRDVLADGRARADAFGANLTDVAGGRFALKTGTSSGFRDAWAAAFDESFTALVWLGDPDGRPLAGVSGFEAAAPAAARILAAARARRAEGGLASAGAATAAPAGSSSTGGVRLVDAAVCAETGLRPGLRCRHLVEERFEAGTVPPEACDAHDEAGDVLLPPRYAEWIARTHPSGVARRPLERAIPDEAPVVREPRDGARWLVDPARGPAFVALRATAGGGELAGVAWEIDGEPLDGTSWEPRPGEHTVVATWRGKRSRPAHVRVDRTAGSGR